MLSRLLRISTIAALAATLTLALAPAPSHAWLHFKSCKGGKCPPKAEEVFDDETQMIIFQMSHQPELMNIEYLKFLIGRPENEASMRGSSYPTYYWYDKDRELQYELKQTLVGGRVTESNMTVNLHGSGMTFDKLESIYGHMARKFFDYSGHPAEMFTFAPSTFLTFSSPPNTFRLKEAKISYRGEPLGPPSAKDMAMAEATMLGKTASQNQTPPSPEEALPMLLARVKVRPMDPEGHLLLADAFRQQSRLHEAIGEYKIALAMSGSNQPVRDKAMDALRGMHIIDDGQIPERRNLEITQHGQRIRVAGHEKKSHKKDQPADPADAS